MLLLLQEQEMLLLKLLTVLRTSEVVDAAEVVDGASHLGDE